jgi:hypothetical protein
LSARDHRGKKIFVRGRRRIYKNRPRVGAQNLPSIQGNLRCCWSAIHRDAIGQKTEHSHARQQAQAYAVVGSLLPPASCSLVRNVTINEEGE